MKIFLAFLGVLLLSGCYGASSEQTSSTGDVPSAEAWIQKYANQGQTHLKNREEGPSPTGYGGSVPQQKSDLFPELKINFKGIGFAKDYSEDRGHVYSVIDLLRSERVTEKTPGACLSCKTSDMAGIFAQQGWAYASRPLRELTVQDHPSVDCFACHDPDTKKLRVIQPGFVEVLARTGVDLSQASQKDMEAYVCAQCHSEYYFEPGTTKVVFPWDQGKTAEAMYAYYSTKPAGFEKDFIQPDSQVALLKAQHPDYEEWSGGIHAQAGVNCVSCHMSVTTDVNGRKFHSHWITSPLKTVATSCLPCHSGKNETWMIQRVEEIQDTVFASLRRAGESLALAHQDLQKKSSSDPVQLEKARSLVREAQWYWDYVGSANSMGFHNSTGAMGNLSKAQDLAAQARILLAQL